jgi:hypothetical protein
MRCDAGTIVVVILGYPRGGSVMVVDALCAGCCWLAAHKSEREGRLHDLR